MKAPQLEVIATSVEDGIAAECGGADRLEVVSTMEADGLTPTVDLVRQLRDAVAIPLRVMLRTRPDFLAGVRDADVLAQAAGRMRAIGVHHFVFGFLTTDSQVDSDAIRSLCSAASPAAWTFHRAFDHVTDPRATVSLCGGFPSLDFVLSAGSPDGVDKGCSVLQERASWQTSSLRWIAGGGLRLAHVPALCAAGITQFHCGRAVRAGQRWNAPVDESLVRAFKEAAV